MILFVLLLGVRCNIQKKIYIHGKLPLQAMKHYTTGELAIIGVGTKSQKPFCMANEHFHFKSRFIYDTLNFRGRQPIEIFDIFQHQKAVLWRCASLIIWQSCHASL